MKTTKTSSLTLSILIGFLFSTPLASLPTKNIVIQNHVFNVEVANTPAERATGLMYRTHLDDKSGMLFSYSTPRNIGIWMKNTYIPLDIIWINEQLKISHFHENARPHSTTIMKAPSPSKYVLELNAGSIKHYKIKRGDIVDIK